MSHKNPKGIERGQYSIYHWIRMARVERHNIKFGPFEWMDGDSVRSIGKYQDRMVVFDYGNWTSLEAVKAWLTKN